MLDGVFRRTEGEPDFQEARAPTRAELEGLLDKIIARLLKMLTRQGYLVEEQGMTYMADIDPDTHTSGFACARAAALTGAAAGSVPGGLILKVTTVLQWA